MPGGRDSCQKKAAVSQGAGPEMGAPRVCLSTCRSLDKRGLGDRQEPGNGPQLSLAPDAAQSPWGLPGSALLLSWALSPLFTF